MIEFDHIAYLSYRVYEDVARPARGPLLRCEKYSDTYVRGRQMFWIGLTATRPILTHLSVSPSVGLLKGKQGIGWIETPQIMYAACTHLWLVLPHVGLQDALSPLLRRFSPLPRWATSKATVT